LIPPNAGDDFAAAEREAVARNLASWEARTPLHLTSQAYQFDLNLLRAGGCCLRPPVGDEIGDISGLRVLHLQCHIGSDTIALARRGAVVTGLDFSRESVAVARQLAAELSVKVQYVKGDAMRADEIFPAGSFDLVFATAGVKCWIPNMKKWIQSASNLLASGGRLYLADGHPVADLFEDDPTNPHGISIANGYFDREGVEYPDGVTYADEGRGQEVPGTTQFHYPLGDLVTFAADAGLRIEYVHEFPYCFYQKYQVMERGEGEVWELPEPLRGKLPLFFSLSARKEP